MHCQMSGRETGNIDADGVLPRLHVPEDVLDQDNGVVGIGGSEGTGTPGSIA